MNLSQFVASTCRFLPPFVARRRFIFSEQFAHFSQGTRYPLLKHGFCGSLKSRCWLHKVPQDGTCNVCQDILRNASHGANRVAFNAANFAASGCCLA